MKEKQELINMVLAAESFEELYRIAYAIKTVNADYDRREISLSESQEPRGHARPASA